MSDTAVCAGVDWAKDAHEVLVADAGGERLWGAAIPQDEAGITRLCQALRAPDRPRAREVTDGPISRISHDLGGGALSCAPSSRRPILTSALTER